MNRTRKTPSRSTPRHLPLTRPAVISNSANLVAQGRMVLRVTKSGMLQILHCGKSVSLAQ